MITRNIDLLLIGHSYLSLILSLDLLEKNQKVLLLDDDRINYGELYTTTLCQIEKNLLMLWGKHKNIPPLANIDKYIRKKPLTLIFDNKRIRLGDSPQGNYLELARKLPFMFKELPPEIMDKIVSKKTSYIGFNNAYDLYCHHLAEKIYEGKLSSEFSKKIFLTECPLEIIEIYDSLRKSLDHEPSDVSLYWLQRTFIYMTRGFYQKKLCSNINDMELFHLLISLLSPQYELDQELLLKDLLAHYKEQGGEFKKTTVGNWFFHKKRPWSIELASYEGIIHPRKVAILSGVVKDIPLRLSPSPNIYSAIEVTWNFHREFGKRWQGERVISSSVNKMGTGRPFWEASFHHNKVVCRVFVPLEKGSKLSFYKEEISTILQEELRELIIDLPRMFLSEEVKFIPEVWVEEYPVGHKGSGNDIPLPRDVDIFDASDINSTQKLKNVYYFGPFKRGPLGLLSSLMALQEAPDYLAN